jgi:4-hydroxy-tetrahydrodipicolinate synthase
MSNPSALRGLWCAMLTPLDADGNVDHGRLAAHARSLLDAGVAGVSPFGTTGEGQSFARAERRDGLERLLAAGIPGERTVAGTGCAALPETIELTRHAVRAGCRGCLVLPPFFWKDASDEGLFAWYARVIEGAGPGLCLYLYHLPQVSGTPLSVDLVERLAGAFPEVVLGVKDSAGNWAHTQALLERVPQLAILVGHEPHLPRLMQSGGAGTICGVANLYPALVQALLSPQVTAADEARIAAFLAIALRHPIVPGFKAIVAQRKRDAQWRAVRLPLVALQADAEGSLITALRDGGFEGSGTTA